jgi:hypothetical protein
MLRYLFLIHRYLGIAVSLLMVTWCLSGFVMIYVSYPRLDESKRVAALPLLDLASGDEVSGTRAIAPDTRISAVKVERVGTDLIAEIQTGARRAVMDLKSGSRAAIDMATAAATAHQFARYAHLPFQYRSAVSLNVDQWTASDEFRGDRPLYKFSWSDADRTELYVSSATGEAVQLTTFKSAFGIGWVPCRTGLISPVCGGTLSHGHSSWSSAPYWAASWLQLESTLGSGSFSIDPLGGSHPTEDSCFGIMSPASSSACLH